MAIRVQHKKYPEDKWWVTGEAEAGKSTFARAWLKGLMTPQQDEAYIWNTDDRLQEYVHVLGEGKILIPDVSSTLDVTKVSDAIDQDLRSGEFSKVAGFVLDNMTHIFQKETGVSQKKALQGEGSAGAAGKAAAMKVIRTVLMSVQKPFITVSHTYIAAGQNLKTKHKRDTISDLELDRLFWCFNARLEIINKDGRYGVRVVSCRDRPGMNSFIIWDKPDNYFAGMPARLRQALYDDEAPQDEPKEWEDFDRDHPFPPDETGAIRASAIQFGARHFVEHDGQKVFAFGDPDLPFVKQDGSEGPSGAFNVANNAYKKIYEGRSDKYPKPKNAGEMTEYWKQYVEARIEKAIAPPEVSPEREEAPEEQVETPEEQSEFTF